ncbi:MAG: PQQ-binding-like beta-propeller repeat protein [Chthoniobacteraceae bacterium]
MKVPSILYATGCILILSFSATLAENWPRFRGPTGQGLSTDKVVPLTWNATENVAWKTEIPGESCSSPIVWEDRVFVTTATDDGASCRIVALDRKDGRVLWKTEVFRQKPGHKQGKNTYATPTPATDGERVYAVFGDGSFAAVKFDGSVAWRNRDFKFYGEHGLGASPIISGELLIMAFDGSSEGPEPKIGWQEPWEKAVLLALDKRTGQERWRGARGPSRIAHITPLIINTSEREELVRCAGDVIQGFNPANGERLWSVRSEGEGVVPSPAFGDGMLFTASGFGQPTIRAVRLGTDGKSAQPKIVWEQRKGVPSQSSLIYVAPHLFAATDGGIATCFDGASGKVVWQERVGGAFSASPVAADGRIYLLSEQGDTTVIEAGAEFKVLAKNAIGERCQASPAISRHQLFIRSEKHVWCIGRE